MDVKTVRTSLFLEDSVMKRKYKDIHKKNEQSSLISTVIFFLDISAIAFETDIYSCKYITNSLVTEREIQLCAYVKIADKTKMVFDNIIYIYLLNDYLLTRWVPLVEQELLTLPGRLSSPHVLMGLVLLDL